MSKLKQYLETTSEKTITVLEKNPYSDHEIVIFINDLKKGFHSKEVGDNYASSADIKEINFNTFKKFLKDKSFKNHGTHKYARIEIDSKDDSGDEWVGYEIFDDKNNDIVRFGTINPDHWYPHCWMDVYL